MAQSAVERNPALRTPTLFEHPVLTDSLLSPWGKKALTFSLNSTRLMSIIKCDVRYWAKNPLSQRSE